MLRLAVVDDDPVALAKIKEELEKQSKDHLFEVEIVCYTDAAQFWKNFLCQKIDALFLDLEMPEVSGFALSQKIREDLPVNLRDVPMVYVTCHEEWMIRSFPYKVIGFVRKQHLEEKIANPFTCVKEI